MNYIDKIKKELREKLFAYVGQAVSKSDFIDLNLLNEMISVTTHSGYEVACIINRKGKVLDIFVGNKTSVSFPSYFNDEVLLNGLRLIHTHPNGDSTLSSLDISALTNNRFDAVCAIGVANGGITDAQIAFINAGDVKEVVDIVKVHNAHYINKFGLMEKLYEYNKIAEDKKISLHSNSGLTDRAILVGVELSIKDDAERDLLELEKLAETAGVISVGKIWQKRSKPDVRYLIGEGKVQELKELVQNKNANLVIFDHELSGRKLSALMSILGVKVIDRSMLILDIFSKRAQTNEGKLQVELAQLKYLLPRLNQEIKGHENSGSGVGLRGPGESKLELNRRIIEKNISSIQKQIDQVKKNRDVARQGRRKSNKKIVSLVGYTNSGKSSLLNKLTNANVYAKDELFATLDTTTRNVYIDEKNEFLLVDTVGFINKLPHELINAFSSTLEESVQADLLLHIVDISNSEYKLQMDTVNEVLQKINANAPTFLVYNKIDRINKLKESDYPDYKNAIFISAKTGAGLDQLKQMIATKLN